MCYLLSEIVDSEEWDKMGSQTRDMALTGPGWNVSLLREARQELGGQRQFLFPAIACGARISSGWAVMPPGHSAVPHIHRHHDIIVAVIEGHVASLLGDELEVVHHAPGDSIHISPGIPHCGVNLSRTDRVVLYECRNDPAFNEDVEAILELADVAREKGLLLQDAFLAPAGAARSVLEIM